MTRSDPRRIQQVLVRMHFDPTFAASVREGASVAGLDAVARGWLRALDPRVFATDPHRRDRVMAGLLDEFPVSAAVAGLDSLGDFFASAAFVAVIEGNENLAEAFARWLQPQAGACARLESGIARVRRARDPAPVPAHHVIASPRAASLVLPQGTTAWWNARRAELGPDPRTELITHRPHFAPPPRNQAREHVLVTQSRAGEISVAGGSIGVHAMMNAARTAVPRERLLAVARRHGADPGEDREILEELASDGLLVLGG